MIDTKTISKFNGIINTKNYAGFVSALGGAVSDPKIQFLLKNGLNDGNLRDDNVKFNLKYIPCYKLRATQNEIDLDKSLSFQLKTMTTQITQIEGGNVTIVGPIITLNGKFVIDGHHRWSQPYCMNPKAKIAALNLERSDLSWIDGLKAAQLSIAANLGTLPRADVSGQNLFAIDKKKLVSYVMSKITDNVAMVMALNENVQVKLGRDITPSTSIYEMKRAVAEYIWENIKVFKKLAAPPAGAPPPANCSGRSFRPAPAPGCGGWRNSGGIRPAPGRGGSAPPP